MREDDPHRDPEASDPLDLAALRADDQFVEYFASGHGPRPGAVDPVDGELTAMFASWVQEVRPRVDLTAVPDPAAPDPTVSGTTVSDTTADDTDDEAPAAPVALARPSVRGPRHAAESAPFVRRIAVAATVVALAGSGLALGAWNAEPGGALWPVATVFYTERARSVEAAAGVTRLHDEAREAISRGDRTSAAAALAAAGQQLEGVAPDQGREDLTRTQADLSDAMSDPAASPRPDSGTGEGGAPLADSTGSPLAAGPTAGRTAGPTAEPRPATTGPARPTTDDRQTADRPATSDTTPEPTATPTATPAPQPSPAPPADPPADEPARPTESPDSGDSGQDSGAGGQDSGQQDSGQQDSGDQGDGQDSGGDGGGGDGGGGDSSPGLLGTVGEVVGETVDALLGS